MIRAKCFGRAYLEGPDGSTEDASSRSSPKTSVIRSLVFQCLEDGVATGFLPAGAARPVSGPLLPLLDSSPPSAAGRPTRTGASGPRLQVPLGSAHPAAMETLYQSQEDALPRVPRQQPIHQPMATTDDLTGHLDQRGADSPTLQPHQR